MNSRAFSYYEQNDIPLCFIEDLQQNKANIIHILIYKFSLMLWIVIPF
jgi:hypothetical protein